MTRWPLVPCHNARGPGGKGREGARSKHVSPGRDEQLAESRQGGQVDVWVCGREAQQDQSQSPMLRRSSLASHYYSQPACTRDTLPMRAICCAMLTNPWPLSPLPLAPLTTLGVQETLLAPPQVQCLPSVGF